MCLPLLIPQYRFSNTVNVCTTTKVIVDVNVIDNFNVDYLPIDAEYSGTCNPPSLLDSHLTDTLIVCDCGIGRLLVAVSLDISII